MKHDKMTIPRHFPEDDVAHYIRARKARDPEFAREFDEDFDTFMLGAMLASARQKAGITQAELARRAHTTKSAICRLERQASDIRLGTLSKLARAMGLHLQVKLT